MILWLDAQLSPYLAPWITSRFKVEAVAVRDLGLRDAKDQEIFLAAREAGATVITKDQDFILLLERLGAPPPVVWATCGNTSNDFLRALLTDLFPKALSLLQAGESLVEIGSSHPRAGR